MPAMRPSGLPPWLNFGRRSLIARSTPGLKSVEGICRNGKVELLESLAEAEGSRVVRFVSHWSRSGNKTKMTSDRRPETRRSHVREATRDRLDLFIAGMNSLRGGLPRLWGSG